MVTWLFLALGFVRKGLSALVGLVARYPWQAALVATLALCVWFYLGRQDARQELADVRAAQKVAGANQAIINHEPARKSEEIARKSNVEAPAYYDSVRRAAAANSVRPQACPVSRPDLPRADSAVEGVHGPAVAPELVCRPAVEDTQLVNASARAAEMRQEALDLITLGVAVPSE